MQLHDTVIRRRGTITTGPYGSGDEINWGTVTDVVYRAEVQPLSSDENVVLQQRVESRWRAFLPPTADVLPTDRIVWDGGTYEIDGDPERWKRRAVLHHLELILTKVSGG